MPEEKQNEAPQQNEAAPPPKSGKSFGKIALFVGIAVAIQTVVLVVWLGGIAGGAPPAEEEKAVDPVDVEFANFKVENIYFSLPLASFASDGSTVSAGLEKQVAITVAIRYKVSEAEEALKELEAQTPWIKQEVRRVIRQEEDPIKVLNEDELTMQRIRETLMMRIRQRIGDDKKNLLVGEEVIFSSFNLSG
mgnify:CR=1 FL=1|jgi:flagellar basal body-associated protein FliL